MIYFVSLLEGIITFISPCLLPMLPIYIAYFVGSADGNTGKTMRASIGFVFGFSFVFTLLGAFAGTVGAFLTRYQTVVNIISGAIVILLGLNFTGILKINFLNASKKLESKVIPQSFWKAFLFGVVFSIGWTPCVGAFLGSALLLASQQGSVLKGILMLLCFSAGLGIPFILSAVLIDRLKGAFAFIKRNYGVINLICGILLILVGILMMTGRMSILFTSISA